MTRKVLLTGGTGQIGSALRSLHWPDDVALVAPDRSALDLSDTASITRCLDDRNFAAILSVGAYTAVDKAESDVGTAWSVNALAPAMLAAAAGRQGIPIIHLSTDYVFDGSGVAPWGEDDAVRPLSVYGASKEGGEQAVRTAAARHVIIRTSWVVSATGNNFIRTMLRLGEQRDSLSVVSDQIGAPTHAADLATTIRAVLMRHLGDAQAPAGTYHFAGGGETSWHGLAERIFAEAERHGRPGPRLMPIPTTAYPTPARRPLNSRLDCRRIARDYELAARPWQETTDDIVRALLASR
jgi:dTDP-4-dehydrorhamnose reductase